MHTRPGTVAARACVILTFLASTLACSFSLTGLGPTETAAPSVAGSPAAKTLISPPGQTSSQVPKSTLVTPPTATQKPSLTPTLEPSATDTLEPSATSTTQPTLKPTLAPIPTKSGPLTSLAGGFGPYTSLIYSNEFTPRQNGFTSEWKVKPGACVTQASNGYLEVCGKLEAFVGDNTWQDYKVTFGGLTVGASVSELSIFVRYQDANNNVKLLCNESPSGAGTWLNCEFHSVVDGADTILKGGAVPHVCDVTCTISVGVQGSKVSLYLMDQALATVTVPGPASGGAGFRVNAQVHNWRLDDFTVYNYGYGAQPGYTLFKDTFSNLFAAKDLNGQYATTKESMGGTYKIDMTAVQDSVVVFHLAKPTLALKDNFYYTLNANLTGADLAYWGLVFRAQDSSNYFVALLDDSGKYAIQALIDDNWETITDWTSTDQFIPRQVNQMGVLGEGADFTLVINGQTVDTFNDARLTGGTFGVIDGLEKQGDASTVDFSGMEVYN
jgi:hypothetical protein